MEPSGTFFLRNKKVPDPFPAMANWVTLGSPKGPHPQLGPSCSLVHPRPHSHPTLLMTPSVTHHWCPLAALDLSPGNVSPSSLALSGQDTGIMAPLIPPHPPSHPIVYSFPMQGARGHCGLQHPQEERWRCKGTLMSPPCHPVFLHAPSVLHTPQ